MSVDVIKKKKRVALVGKRIKNKKSRTNSDNEEDIVSEIMKSMDDGYSAACLSILENKKRTHNTGDMVLANFSLSVKDRVKQQVKVNQNMHSPKFLPGKKPPLMAKCQKNLKYIKHNRAIPKQRAHIGTLPKSPKSATEKRHLPKSQVSSESLPKPKKKTYSGNIWMVNEMNNRKLLSSDSSDADDAYSDSKEPVFTKSNSETSSEDSDFENFITSQRETVTEENVSNTRLKKHKKSKLKKNKSNQSALNCRDTQSKKCRNANKSRNISVTSTDDSDINEAANKTDNVESNCSSVNVSPLILSNSRVKNKDNLDNNCANFNDKIVKEKTCLKSTNCSVRLERNPILDGVIPELTSESPDKQSSELILKSPRNLMNSIAESASDNENNVSPDDDIEFICVVPKQSSSSVKETITRDDSTILVESHSSKDSVNENSNVRDLSQKTSTTEVVLSKNSVKGLYGSDEEQTAKGNQRYSDKEGNDLGIQISSVTSFDENMKNCSNISFNELENKSYDAQHILKEPNPNISVNVDELLRQIDVERLKEVITESSTLHGTQSLNFNLVNPRKNLNSSDIFLKETVNNADNRLSVNDTLNSKILSKEVFTEANKPTSESVKDSTSQDALETAKKIDFMNVLPITKSNVNPVDEEEFLKSNESRPIAEPQSSESFINQSFPKKPIPLINTSIENDLFWKNIKDAITANYYFHQGVSRADFLNTDEEPVKLNDLSEMKNTYSNFNKQGFNESASDELDVIASCGIQHLVGKPKNIVPLMKLYTKEMQYYDEIKSAGKNVSVGLKILEETQAKKVQSLKAAIQNYCKRDPCFFKVMEDAKVIKSEIPINKTEVKPNTSSSGEDENPKSCKRSDRQNQFLCKLCEKKAKMKCLGCNDVFFCSSECGALYWERVHHAECQLIASST